MPQTSPMSWMKLSMSIMVIITMMSTMTEMKESSMQEKNKNIKMYTKWTW